MNTDKFIEVCPNFLRNVGMMRQWLNEERIDAPKKMVSNEDILYWLNIKES